MKKLAFLILLLLPALLFSQPYKSIFSGDTTRWNVFQCKPDNSMTIAYYSYSDTLINNKVYHKLYREIMNSADYQIGYDPELSGFIHEDTLTGKYWFLKYLNSGPQEVLFMDLSLNKGDTMTFLREFRYNNTINAKVDTVFFVNGRKIIHLQKGISDCFIENIRFIEGIGPTNGFYLDVGDPRDFTLICKFHNSFKIMEVIAEHDYIKDCFIQGGGGVFNDALDKAISIFPNPSSGKITVSLSEFMPNLTYTLFNCRGDILSEGSLESTENVLFTRERGALFLRISDGKIEAIKNIIVIDN